MLLVFDLDGTLVDSIRDLAEAASDLSEAYGGPRLDDGQVTLMVGEGIRVLVERVLALTGRPDVPPEALETFHASYRRRMFDNTRAYPGMIDTLNALADTHALALLTNKSEEAARQVLVHAGLDAFFPHRVFGDGDLARKPSPDGLRWLMGRNGASAERTLLIGDSDVDVNTARATGVRLCLARYGFGFLRVQPHMLRDEDVIIDQPTDLIHILDAGRP